MSNARDMDQFNDHAVAMFLRHQTKGGHETAAIQQLIQDALQKLETLHFPNGKLKVLDSKKHGLVEYVSWPLYSKETINEHLNSRCTPWALTSLGTIRFQQNENFVSIEKLSSATRETIIRLLKEFIERLDSA